MSVGAGRVSKRTTTAASSAMITAAAMIMTLLDPRRPGRYPEPSGAHPEQPVRDGREHPGRRVHHPRYLDVAVGLVVDAHDKVGGVADALGNLTKSGVPKPLTLQIGDTSESFNQMDVNVKDMHTTAMGTEGGKSIADINIGTQMTVP